jgi:hypothetical protein
MLEDLKRAAWARTSPVSSANAWDIRKDFLGNMVRYTDFGNRHSPFGWELEYVGSRDPENLHAMNWKAVAARSQAVLPRLVAA